MDITRSHRSRKNTSNSCTLQARIAARVAPRIGIYITHAFGSLEAISLRAQRRCNLAHKEKKERPGIRRREMEVEIKSGRAGKKGGEERWKTRIYTCPYTYIYTHTHGEKERERRRRTRVAAHRRPSGRCASERAAAVLLQVVLNHPLFPRFPRGGHASRHAYSTHTRTLHTYRYKERGARCSIVIDRAGATGGVFP